MDNPWRVDSIQEFSCLKCPECDYFNKEESYFKDHAISNHSLSSVLFDKTKPKSEGAVKVEMPDCVSHVTVEDIKKEPAELDSVAEDPLNFCDTSTHQEEHCMSLKAGNELPNDKDVPNSKLKPVKQKRKQSHLELRNDYDEINAFDNEPNIPEKQPKKPKKKQKIDNNQAPVSISDQIADNYSCRLCDYKTDDRRKLKIHLENHIEAMLDKSYDCSLCEFKSNSCSKFNYHLKNHKNYQCLNCKVNFHGPNSPALFRMHLKKSQVEPPENPCNGQHEITCGICKFKCNEEVGFKTHFVKDHEQLPLKCPKCDFKTFQKIYLYRHIEGHYDCELCEKVFCGRDGKRQLARHMKAHKLKLTVRTVCDFCNNPYSKLSNLKRHEKVCPKKEEVLRAMDNC